MAGDINSLNLLVVSHFDWVVIALVLGHCLHFAFLDIKNRHIIQSNLQRFFFFFVQFNVPFKIISLILRRANQKVGRKREYPGKNHLTHAQVELDLSHL